MRPNLATKTKYIKSLGLLMVFTIVFSSCYKDIEGCSDPLAENYSIDYDIPCSDGCCAYPSVEITWNHLYDGENFRHNAKYPNFVADTFMILDQKIYFGDVIIEGFDGPLTYLENITYTTTSGTSLVVSNDFFLLKKTLTSSKFSMVRYAGTISNISFSTKLNDDLNVVNSDVLSSISPLSNNENMRDADENFYSAFFKIAHGQNLQDTVNYYLKTTANSTIDIVNSDTIIQGNNITANLQINYDDLFYDIDFNNLTKDDITAKLEDHLPNIFSEVE